MKVLHLISSGGLFGAERVVLTLASYNKSIDLWVGALNNHHNPHLEIIEEAKPIGLNTVVFDSRSQLDLKTIFSVKRFLKENKIDILHSHNSKSHFIGFWATRFSYTQWVATNHTWHSTDSKMRFYESIDVFDLKFAKMIFTVSENIKDQMLSKGFRDDHIHVIHNGINIAQFSQNADKKQLRADWKVSNEETLLTIVGRLAPEKGHEILFKSLTMVIKECPFVKCLVVGDGPLKNKLKIIVKNLNLSNHIIFSGIRKDMPAVYSACDIMVNASSIEGLPMTILEAMASRLPIVATNVGAVPQVIHHEKNGLLLDPNDPETLAKALIQLIKDPQKRQQLTNEAYSNVITSFSDQIMFDKYKEYYDQILK